MRIANLGAPFLVEALKAQGHEVLSVGWHAACQVQINSPLTAGRLADYCAELGFVPDASLYVDDGNMPFVVGLERLPWPSAYYAIDTFCNPWQVPYSYAFDLVCVAQKGYLDLFGRGPAQVAWLPLFATSLPALDDDHERDIPVAFVGTLQPKNIPDRLPFLQAFKAQHPLVYMSGDYVPVFVRSQLVLNQTAASELNFRCFEAMACGAALLTEIGPHGLCDLFVPGEHILPPYTRGDAQGAAALAANWLNRPEQLHAVAQNGTELVRRTHSAMARATSLVAMLAPLCAEQAQKARLATLDARKPFIGAAYAMLASELVAPEYAAHRDLYKRLWQQAL